ncbi:hypothetical protein BdWA1_000597 [Babesia duncani]|uniref:Uncharacterized protein n=1 Tax=Babesia duncani TaxID=323732 RepID=A0AAD9PMV6_9APIC|nr:hypothetical protein BdWA1_000597 [Babesia duncani]
MSAQSKDIKSEFLACIAAAAVAWFLWDSTKKKRASFLYSLFSSGNTIDNIYKLLPILRKNAKVLFLIFNDVASAINSLSSNKDTSTDFKISRDVVKSILSQESVQKRLTDAQNEVFREFGIDQYELQSAIERFSQDDQVQMYINGVELMYNKVLDGGYPQCPGIEICETLTKQRILEILERICQTKFEYLKSNNGEIMAESIETRIIHEEMSKLGFTNTFESLVAFKNTENCFQYDFDFIKDKVCIIDRMYSHHEVPKEVDEDVLHVTQEDLNIMLDTMDAHVPLYLILFAKEPDVSYIKHVKDVIGNIGDAVLVWMLAHEQKRVECTEYPALVLLKNGKLEVSCE